MFTYPKRPASTQVEKANTQSTAKSEWYDWKLQWVQRLYATADDGFNALKGVNRAASFTFNP
jgi:hypothetical protein